MQARQGLSTQQRAAWDARILANLLRCLNALPTQCIGLYWPHNGEADVRAIMQQHTADYALPILDATQSLLHWGRYAPGDALKKNCYGIPEPVSRERLQASQLDVIIMPMVGFNLRGDRLGHGAGYYDRSLAFKKKQPLGKPMLIGIAYSLQQGDFVAQAWDVPVDWVITEDAMLHTREVR
jgi:5-formyltetrahydrofolate cyclo-ligase